MQTLAAVALFTLDHEGSSRTSSFGALGSEWSPIGRKGNLSVPLLGLGVTERESQTIL